MAVNLRTEQQKQREKRAERVCDMYSKLKKDNAGSDTQICAHIAEEISKKFTPISPMGVRYILKKRHLYEPANGGNE